MKEIKAVAKKIKEQNAAVDLARAAVERCESVLAAGLGVSANDGLEALKAKRREIAADAFIAQKDADTSDIDAQIATLIEARKQQEAERSSVQAQKSAAQDALPILKQRLDEAEQALTALTEQHRRAVADYIVSLHDAALSQYLEMVDGLAAPVEAMVAAEKAWKMVAGAKSNFPARGSTLLRDLRDKGLRVTWEKSALNDEAVASEYADGYQDYWYVPKWADARNVDFGNKLANSTAADLRSIGVQMSELPKADDAPEATVEIEVVTGSVTSVDPASVVRDPATGGVIHRKMVSYPTGSRLFMGESDAKSLVKTGFARYAAELDAERAQQSRLKAMAEGASRATVYGYQA